VCDENLAKQEVKAVKEKLPEIISDFIVFSLFSFRNIKGIFTQRKHDPNENHYWVIY
jgi:hypothetical protein